MNLIVDASVASKWFLDERGSEEAREVARNALRAPDLILAETFNAVWKRWRRGEATADQLAAIVPALRRTIGDFVPIVELMHVAARISEAYRHPVYDCIYLAAAIEAKLPLVTADERQFAVARRATVEVRLL